MTEPAIQAERERAEAICRQAARRAASTGHMGDWMTSRVLEMVADRIANGSSPDAMPKEWER